MQISVVIPTLNEEKDLPRTLSSLKFAKEILVIDSGSTDNTVQIAEDFGCKVVFHPFSNFADTRNFGDKNASCDFILSIDADVTVPQSLVNEIISLPQTPSSYKIGRINIIWGKPILHTDWGPADDNHIRLYHRSLGSWSFDVHETFVSKSPSKQLKNFLTHYNYETVSEFIGKINSYSEIQARKLIDSGEKKSFFKMIYQSKYDFFKRYLYKLGFLDGYRGLFLSYLQAVYYLSVGIKQKTK